MSLRPQHTMSPPGAPSARGLVLRFPDGLEVPAVAPRRAAEASVGLALALAPMTLVAHALIAAWFAVRGIEIPLVWAQVRWPVAAPALGTLAVLLLAAWPPGRPVEAPWKHTLTEPLTLRDAGTGLLGAACVAPLLALGALLASPLHAGTLLPHAAGALPMLVLGAAAVGAVQGAILQAASRSARSPLAAACLVVLAVLPLHLHAALDLSHAVALVVASLPAALGIGALHAGLSRGGALVVMHAALAAGLAIVT